MVVVPTVSALSIPVDELIVATAVLLLVQEPPAAVFNNVSAVPAHADVPPVMLAGAAITVIGLTTKHEPEM